MKRPPDFAYLIYDADVVAAGTRFIEQMAPAVHMTAGYSGEGLAFNTAVAARFTQTEGDEQWDFGYLADEGHRNPDYYPLGFADAEALHTDKCLHCRKLLNYNEDAEQYEDDRGDPCPVNETGLHDPDEDAQGKGQHRKWVAELTLDQWRAFAEAYGIDLESDGDETAWLPARYEETLGMLTEYGFIGAISVDNQEGWDNPHNGDCVISSSIYVNFGWETDPDLDEADLRAIAEWESDGGAVLTS